MHAHGTTGAEPPAVGRGAGAGIGPCNARSPTCIKTQGGSRPRQAAPTARVEAGSLPYSCARVPEIASCSSEAEPNRKAGRV